MVRDQNRWEKGVQRIVRFNADGKIDSTLPYNDTVLGEIQKAAGNLTTEQIRVALFQGQHVYTPTGSFALE